jgi:hypothetical protein
MRLVTKRGERCDRKADLIGHLQEHDNLSADRPLLADRIHELTSLRLYTNAADFHAESSCKIGANIIDVWSEFRFLEVDNAVDIGNQILSAAGKLDRFFQKL